MNANRKNQVKISILSKIVIYMIKQYQFYISPYKGYHCAHAILHGRDSCSSYAKRVIGKYGIITGLKLLFHRFRSCKVAAFILAQSTIVDQANAAVVVSQNQGQGCEACGALTAYGCASFMKGFCGA